MTGEARGPLSETDQKALYKQCRDRARREGGDPIAEIELAARTLDRRLYPRDKVVTAFLEAAATDDTALAELLGKKTARRERVKAGEKAYARGERAKLFADIPLSDLQEKAEIANGVRALALKDKIREQYVAEKAGADDEGPDYADVAEIIANGVEHRETDAGGIRNDGVRLGYRGKTHSLLGPPESGKTLVAIAQACDELRIGGAA